MIIGVISDTHGNALAWRKAMRLFEGADLILHAGDVLYHPPRFPVSGEYDLPALAELINSCPTPIVIARGNCDPEVYEEILDQPALSPYAFVQLEGLKIIVTHGHNLAAEGPAKLAEKYDADLLITGHTHMPMLEQIGKVIHLNPGSASHPKYEREGEFIPTVGLVENGTIRVLKLDTGVEIYAISLNEAD